MVLKLRRSRPKNNVTLVKLSQIFSPSGRRARIVHVVQMRFRSFHIHLMNTVWNYFKLQSFDFKILTLSDIESLGTQKSKLAAELIFILPGQAYLNPPYFDPALLGRWICDL